VLVGCDAVYLKVERVRDGAVSMIHGGTLRDILRKQLSFVDAVHAEWITVAGFLGECDGPY
jgi:hypothetical protein